MKRIFLFIATNIAVIAVMSIVLSLLGVDRFLTSAGLNLPMLLVFSLVVGFTGSIFSLLISKPMAKWSTGAHVANGDMGTMTLIQGVGNTFVVFLSRVVGYAGDRALSRDNNSGPGIGYMVTVIVCQIVFGIAASLIVAWFSRYREFRADAGSAQLLGGPQPMIKALARLGSAEPNSSLPQSMAAMGISDKPGFLELFSSHPPIEQRISALRSMR